MRDFLRAKLWWIGWSDNLHLATPPKMHTFHKWKIEEKDTLLFSIIHFAGPRSHFLSRILQFLRVLCFRAYHQKVIVVVIADLTAIWKPFETICNQYLFVTSVHTKEWKRREKFKVIDFKSQFRMKPLEKLVKLLYVAACVGFFLEEAFVCLVHYVSK